MYVTKPLSHYIRHPESLSTPPEGPNSGYLVLQDDDSVTCFGLCKSRYLIDLPFPQNKNLTLCYSSYTSGNYRHVSYDDAVFIPVLNQPLSSNRYYAVKPHGSNKGAAYASSREENASMMACCLYCIHDEYPRPLDPSDMYQQFRIAPYETFFSNGGRFTALSIAPDGIPPHFMRQRGWVIYGKTPKKFKLGEALGVNATLRAQLPTFDFPLSIKSSEPIVVGKWYCPFMFIKDGTLKDQVNRSMYYEMTLEQRWEQICASESDYNQGNSVNVNQVVKTKLVLTGGREAKWDEKNVANGIVWFKSTNEVGDDQRIGLSSLIIERMEWEVTRFGWVKGKKRQVKVYRMEEFTGVEGWSRFGCYVLVERFNLKRMDGSVALTCDFKHTQLMRSKWE